MKIMTQVPDDKGVLQTFCMSRIPTRKIKQSNGHSKGADWTAFFDARPA